VVAEAEVPVGQWEAQFGAWRYSQRFAARDPTRPPALSQGAYALIEGPITPHVSAWLRTGMADARTNPVAIYIGGGVVLETDGWDFGFALAHARAGNAARHQIATPAKAETALELTARRAVAPGASLQPDVQYVIDPGWNASIRPALVMGLRVSLSWPAG